MKNPNIGPMTVAVFGVVALGIAMAIALVIWWPGGRSCSMKILAIDPGVSTGVIFVDPVQPEESTYGKVIHLWEQLDKIIERTSPDVIVIEAFRLYPHMAKTMIGNDFPSSQVIGVTKYLAAKAGIPVVEQMASMAKHIAKNPRLHNPHLQDAWRHAAVYWRRNK